MSTMITEHLDRPVVAVDGADTVGSVKAFVVDRSGRRIDRLQIGGGRRNGEFVSWSAVEGVGDVVTISSAERTSGARTDRDSDVAKGTIDLIGTRILGTDGVERGTVDDAGFDAETGEILSVVGPDGPIPADEIVSLGSYALVVRS